MTEFLTDLGMKTWDPFWVPVLIWSGLALASVIMLRMVPKKQIRLHLDVRMALLIALPIGLLLANVLPLTTNEVTYIFVVPAPGLSGIPSVSTPLATATIGVYTIIGALTCLVLVSSVVGLLRFASAYVRLHRLIRTAVPFENPAMQSHFGQKWHRVDVLVSDKTPVAFSFGVFRKKIVIPTDDEPEKRLVFIHELMHHEDGDVVRAAIGQIVTSLFFFHPLVHLVHRETRLFVELSCDQEVLAQSGVERNDYALLLLRYARHARFNSSPALSMADTRSHLYRRIQAMKNPILNVLSQRSVLLIAAFVLGAGVFVAACTESALVAPGESDFEEIDVMARTMGLPVAEGTDPYIIVEYPPKLIGGLTGLIDGLEYPEIARKAGIEGRVFLQFIVQPDGTPSEILVLRGIGAGCDEEAVRVLSEARFIPGVQDNHRVPVKFSLSFTFKLPPPESSSQSTKGAN